MPDPLRVVMVTTSYPRRQGDFAGHFVASLASAIADLGHDVEVVAPHDPGIPAVEEISGVPVCRARYAPERFERLAYREGIVPNIRRSPVVALAAPLLASALRRGVRQCARGADVVHAHWAPTAALSAADQAGVPLVVSLHGSDLTLATRGGPWRALLKRGLSGAHGVNVMAQSQKDVLLGSGLYKGLVEVIPSGISPTLIDRERPARPDDGLTRILFVGRLVRGKGTHDLMSAFAKVAEVVPGARLTIAGAGQTRGKLAASAAALHVADKVEFVGEVPHARALELMTTADILTLPSYGEGSPLSVTEALALGTPVVGTTVGAMPELVGDSGLLVAPGDVEGLARALIELANDPGRRAEMGAAARIRMGRDYGWPGIARRTVALYREAIECAKAGQ